MKIYVLWPTRAGSVPTPKNTYNMPNRTCQMSHTILHIAFNASVRSSVSCSALLCATLRGRGARRLYLLGARQCRCGCGCSYEAVSGELDPGFRRAALWADPCGYRGPRSARIRFTEGISSSERGKRDLRSRRGTSRYAALLWVAEVRHRGANAGAAQRVETAAATPYPCGPRLLRWPEARRGTPNAAELRRWRKQFILKLLSRQELGGDDHA
jgi:hypothetical protein